MFFKNLVAFRLPNGFALSAADLSEKLATQAFSACGSSDPFSVGWVSPVLHGQLAHSVNGQYLLALKREEKILPGAVIARFLKERVEKIEENEGRKVGRKEKRDLKESVTAELRPRAFTIEKCINVWIDPVNHWLGIDASSISKAEEALEFLRKTVDPSPKVALLQTVMSPSAAMSGWLAEKNAPAGFTLDQDLELCSAEQSKVRYVKHSLESDEITEHLAGGKVATRMAMTWNDRISFVLTNNLQIKQISFLDIMKEEASNQAENAEECFDIEFTLMSGELARLMDAMVDALGGEITKE